MNVLSFYLVLVLSASTEAMSILIKHFSFVAFLPPFGTLFFYFHSIKTTLAERGKKKGQGCNVMVQNFQCLKKRK